MNHIKIAVTQTFHYHGFAMDTAVAKAINALGNTPSQVEITAQYVIDDDVEGEGT